MKFLGIISCAKYHMWSKHSRRKKEGYFPTHHNDFLAIWYVEMHQNLTWLSFYLTFIQLLRALAIVDKNTPSESTCRGHLYTIHNSIFFFFLRQKTVNLWCKPSMIYTKSKKIYNFFVLLYKTNFCLFSLWISGITFIFIHNLYIWITFLILIVFIPFRSFYSFVFIMCVSIRVNIFLIINHMKSILYLPL